MLTVVSDKISKTLSFQSNWQPIQSSLNLIRRVHEFQRLDNSNKLLVIYAEPGCGVTTALRKFYQITSSQALWVSSRLIFPKATLYDRLARSLGVFNVCAMQDRLEPYMRRLMKLRRIKVIYIDDADEYMIERSSADSMINMITELRNDSIIKYVISIKAPATHMKVLSLFNDIDSEIYYFGLIESDDCKPIAREILRQLNLDNNTSITFDADLQGWHMLASSVGELVEWLKLAYAVTWVSESQVITSDLNITGRDLWGLLDEYLD